MDTGAGYVPHRSSRHYGDPTVTKGINHIQTAYQVGVSAEQVTINPWVTLKQREDFAYLADTSGSNYPQGREIEATLTSTIRSYSRQGLVPFGAINRWQDYSGEVLQLLLVKADEANTVRICTHINSVLAKRLHCVTWEVPTDWTWGKELKGGKHYMIDDRTVYEGQSGFFFWN